MTTAHFSAEGVPQRLLYPVREAMVLLALSRSTIYEQLRCGRLRSVTQGATRLIPAAALTDYVELLEKEAKEDGNGEAA
ncbi:excisionase family DNA-binding protein [Saccharopolyspora dendranthemae]|uniref:Excisionase family DNA binding protein n=1 Tax=Saccharopolyspora dendranthemae TaxID=1181886 RepID=A0A561U211_9PSEU|nr:excisionase family DNA-binding protein [Saccharopolyspora dendranthemae]TWF93360.1 excisionase family DNA binding protein [Saccharopolyspora dendranthemae]